MKVINRKTLAKKGGGSGTTSTSKGHNTSTMSTAGLVSAKSRTKARKPAKASGGTRAVRHTTYGGGPAITKVRETT